MKIELKNIKVNLQFSEETTMFKADVFVDGKKVAYAKNDGFGGETYYHHYEGMKDLLEQAEKYCKNLPPTKYKTMVIDMNLEQYIDNLLYSYLDEKEKKKMEKKTKNSLIWGVPDTGSYVILKFNKPLSEIPTIELQSYVNKYKKEFKDGEKFFNTNLEELGIKI